MHSPCNKRLKFCFSATNLGCQESDVRDPKFDSGSHYVMSFLGNTVVMRFGDFKDQAMGSEQLELATDAS